MTSHIVTINSDPSTLGDAAAEADVRAFRMCAQCSIHPRTEGVDADICVECLGVARPEPGDRISYRRAPGQLYSGVVRADGCPTAEPGEVCSFVHVDVDGDPGRVHHVPLNRIVTPETR